MTDRSTDNFGDAPVFADETGGLPENLLRHYAAVLRRRSRWVILGLVVGLLAGIGSTFLVREHRVTTHYYKATNTLVVDSAAPSNDGGNSGYSLQQATLLVQSQTLLDSVAKSLNLTPEQVAKQLSATTRSDVQAIDVTGIATNPALAVKLANTGSEQMQTVAEKTARDQAVKARTQAQKQLDDLEKQRQQLIDEIATKPPNVDLLNEQLNSVVSDYGQYFDQLRQMGPSAQSLTFSTLQPATAIEINGRGFSYRITQNTNARNQIAQNGSNQAQNFDETALGGGATVSKPTRVVLGATSGLVLGLISAFLVEAWDDRLRRREKVEELTGLPVLAEIPKLSRDQAKNHSLAVIDDASSPASERYRAARTSVLFALEARTGDGDAGTKTSVPIVMVTSPGPGEGKTTTAANLAGAFADGGMRTLVIDGDFRRPSIRRLLAPVPNLVAPDDPCETRIDRVRFLAGPHGMRSPDEAVHELRRSIERWRHDYDIVVLDTPPILTTNDAADLLDVADAVVLVLRAGQTRTGPARRVVSLLNRFRADVLGVVLNSVDRSEMDPYYGYGYGYLGKKSSSDGGDSRKAEPKTNGSVTAKDVDAKGLSGLNDELSEFWSKRGGSVATDAPDAPTNGNGNGSAKRPEADPSSSQTSAD